MTLPATSLSSRSQTTLALQVRNGLCCPACNSSDTEVKDSRPFSGGIRRRRLCTACRNRFTTYEVHGLDKVQFADLLQFDAMLSRLDPDEIALLRSMLQRFLRDKGV